MGLVGRKTSDVLQKHNWEIWSFYHQGMTPDEIAKKISCSSNLVVRAIKSLGLKIPKINNVRVGIKNQDRANRIIAAREDDQTYKEIGENWNISGERVRQILHSAGRSDLCGKMVRQKRQRDSYIFKHKLIRGMDARVSEILALRRQLFSWQKIGLIIYPNMEVGWAAQRCRRDVQRVAKRYNLNSDAAFYDLRNRR